MSDDDRVPKKKFLVGLVLVVGMGVWIGVSGQLLSFPWQLLGIGVYFAALVLFGRWKPS